MKIIEIIREMIRNNSTAPAPTRPKPSTEPGVKPGIRPKHVPSRPLTPPKTAPKTNPKMEESITPDSDIVKKIANRYKSLK